jgi:hypothetical protein
LGRGPDPARCARLTSGPGVRRPVRHVG